MLEEFLKEYLSIDSVEDIINVNLDNLTKEGKLFYNIVCDYNFRLDEMLPEIVEEVNLQTGFSFAVEHKEKDYSYSTEEVSPSLILDGDCGHYYEKHYNVVDAIILNDHLNNVKSILTEKETSMEFEPNYKLINEEIYDYLSINNFKKSKFGPIFAKIIYNILIKHLKMEEDKVIGNFKAYYELQFLDSVNKLEKAKNDREDLKNNLIMLNYNEEEMQECQNTLKDTIKKEEELHKKIRTLPQSWEIYDYSYKKLFYDDSIGLIGTYFKDFLNKSPYIFFLASLNEDLTFTIKRVANEKEKYCFDYNPYTIDEIKSDDYNPYGLSFIVYNPYLTAYMETRIYVFVEWPKEFCELISLISDLRHLLSNFSDSASGFWCYEFDSGLYGYMKYNPEFNFDMKAYNEIKNSILGCVSKIQKKYEKLFKERYDYSDLSNFIGNDAIKKIVQRHYIINFLESFKFFSKDFNFDNTRVEGYKNIKKEFIEMSKKAKFTNESLQTDERVYNPLKNFIKWIQNIIIEFDKFCDDLEKYKMKIIVEKERKELSLKHEEIAKKYTELENKKEVHDGFLTKLEIENNKIEFETETQKYLISQINKINELDYKEEIKLARKK